MNSLMSLIKLSTFTVLWPFVDDLDVEQHKKYYKKNLRSPEWTVDITVIMLIWV